LFGYRIKKMFSGETELDRFSISFYVA
jgi:hypothetical protein